MPFLSTTVADALALPFAEVAHHLKVYIAALEFLFHQLKAKYIFIFFLESIAVFHVIAKG